MIPIATTSNWLANPHLKPSIVYLSNDPEAAWTMSITKPVKYIITKLARNPPTLANPFAEPSLSLETMSFVKSKAIIEAGPPMEIAKKQTKRIGLMICPGIETITNQVKVVRPTTR